MKEHVWVESNWEACEWKCTGCGLRVTCVNKPNLYPRYGTFGDFDPLLDALKDCNENVCKQILEA